MDALWVYVGNCLSLLYVSVCVCVPETAVFQRKFTTQVGDNHQNSDEKGLLKWGSANVHNSLGKIEAATPGRTEGSPKSSLGGGTQIFFIFTPYFGKMHPIWQKKKSIGLVQPPTRKSSSCLRGFIFSDFVTSKTCGSHDPISRKLSYFSGFKGLPLV